MAVTLNQVQNGLAVYIDREIIPHMTGWRQLAFGTVSALLLRRSEELFQTLKENKIAQATGVIREDGMIDILLLKDQLKQQIEKSGPITLDIPEIGALKVGPADVDRLYQLIMEA